jgi:hypothetical protein
MTPETAIEPLLDKAGPPTWRVPVPWWTRQCVRLDVLMHRNFSASIVVVGLIALLLLVPIIIATLALAEIDKRLALVLLITAGPLISGLVLWINARLSHRTTARAASAAEVAALRGYSPAREWAHVQAAAADWRASRPRVPITITMILHWQDEAARAEREALPSTIAEQAANRAQARAFE